MWAFTAVKNASFVNKIPLFSETVLCSEEMIWIYMNGFVDIIILNMFIWNVLF